MAVAKQTMTDEQRKSVVIDYLKAFDRAGKTWDGGSILDLFADDAQVYFPKLGVAYGKQEIGQMFGDIGSTLKWIKHHFSHFNFIFSGSDLVVCEGTSEGEHRDGPWRAGAPEHAAGRGATCSRYAIGRFSGASSILTRLRRKGHCAVSVAEEQIRPGPLWTDSNEHFQTK